MHGLDLFFSRHSQILILRTLYRNPEALTGRQIQRRTGLSNRATMMALENLHACRAVNRVDEPNCYLFSLNERNYLVKKALIPAFEAETLFWDDLRKAIRRWTHPRPIAAVATGPMVRDETLPSGKLELTLLFQNGRSRIHAFSGMETLIEQIWDRYAVAVEPILLDPNSMYHESYEALWRRIEREGVLLFGTLP